MILLTFGNSILRGAEIELDGVIVAIDYVPVPIAQYLLVQGPWEPISGHANRYTNSPADGRSATFIAGQACSLLYEKPRKGVAIHKEAWRLGYALNGRPFSDFSTASTACVTHVPITLITAALFLAIALRRRRSI